MGPGGCGWQQPAGDSWEDKGTGETETEENWTWYDLIYSTDNVACCIGWILNSCNSAQSVQILWCYVLLYSHLQIMWQYLYWAHSHEICRSILVSNLNMAVCSELTVTSNHYNCHLPTSSTSFCCANVTLPGSHSQSPWKGRTYLSTAGYSAIHLQLLHVAVSSDQLEMLEHAIVPCHCSHHSLWRLYNSLVCPSNCYCSFPLLSWLL